MGGGRRGCLRVAMVSFSRLLAPERGSPFGGSLPPPPLLFAAPKEFALLVKSDVVQRRKHAWVWLLAYQALHSSPSPPSLGV